MKIIDNIPVLRRLSNKYILTGLGFIVWMIFLDTNNYFIHAELDRQINQLENDIKFYEASLAPDKLLLNQLESDSAALERFARENHGMHREGETVTIIEFETEQDE